MYGPRTKFLVVDDLSAMRQIVRDLLKELGYESVELADNGEKALAKMKTGEVDFLIADWNMPVMDGLKLLQEIRAHPSLCKMPVLMITAEARKENIIAAAQAGANGYVVKPFTAAILKHKIAEIFNSLHAKS